MPLIVPQREEGSARSGARNRTEASFEVLKLPILEMLLDRAWWMAEITGKTLPEKFIINFSTMTTNIEWCCMKF